MSTQEPTSPGPLPQAEELLDLLARQHELYRELRRLALSQRDLIAAEDPSALLNLLSQRQKLIDRLAEINLRLEPVRAAWKHVEAMLTTEQHQRASRLVGEVGRLLTEILQADEADSKLLSARKAMVGQQIQATAASAQVQKAYRRGAAPVNRPATGSTFDKS